MSKKRKSLNFAQLHKIRTSRIINGRNPNSLPRQSELWHYCKKANDRVNRMRKRANIFDVIDKHEQLLTVENIVGDLHFEKPEIVQEVFGRFIYVNGAKIDMEMRSSIHFGSLLVVIVNPTHLLNRCSLTHITLLR